MEPLLYLFGIIASITRFIGLLGRNVSRWEHLYIMTAKRCLLRNWIHTNTPTIQELLVDIKHLFLLERLEADMASRIRWDVFLQCWKHFIVATFTGREAEELMTRFNYGYDTARNIVELGTED